MAALMYALLAVAYALSVWSLSRQRRHTPESNISMPRRRVGASHSRPGALAVRRGRGRAAA